LKSFSKVAEYSANFGKLNNRSVGDRRVFRDFADVVTAVFAVGGVRNNFSKMIIGQSEKYCVSFSIISIIEATNLSIFNHPFSADPFLLK
jgi:hypothetical protein